MTATVEPSEAECIAMLRGVRAADCLQSLPAEERSYLRIPVPSWVGFAEDLKKFFDQYIKLWSGGHIVWAHIVQANNALFEPGDQGAPGELIYDPNGQCGPHLLAGYAHALGSLKGTKPANPELRRIADHLTNEYTRAFAMPVPAAKDAISGKDAGGGGLLLSTTYFHRAHLPGGSLLQGYLPVLINARYPGIVMVLPERWWPSRFRAFWLGDALPAQAGATSASCPAPALQTSSRRCPHCREPMGKISLAAHYQREVEIDVCRACSLIWFDETESARVAGPGVADLVRLIHAAMQTPRPLQPMAQSLPCPICDAPMKRVSNLSRFGKTAQMECPEKHGALQSFTQFLAEKGYFRPFTWQDIKGMVEAGELPNCFNCGAALEARPQDECPFCRSPVGMIDPARLARAIDVQGAAPALALAPMVKSSACPCCGGAVELSGEMACPHCLAIIRPPQTAGAQAAAESVEDQVRRNYERQSADVSRRKLEALAAMPEERVAGVPVYQNVRRTALGIFILAAIGFVYHLNTMRKMDAINKQDGLDFQSDAMLGLSYTTKLAIDGTRAAEAMKTVPHAPPGTVPPQLGVKPSGNGVMIENLSDKHVRVTLSYYNEALSQRCYFENADGPAGQKNVEFKKRGETHSFTALPCPAKVLQNAAYEYTVLDLDEIQYLFKSDSAFYRFGVTDETNKQ